MKCSIQILERFTCAIPVSDEADELKKSNDEGAAETAADESAEGAPLKKSNEDTDASAAEPDSADGEADELSEMPANKSPPALGAGAATVVDGRSVTPERRDKRSNIN